MPLGYNCETVYKAELAHDSIYFVFTNRRKSLLSIMRADISDDGWTHYTVGAAIAEVRHYVVSGTWVIRFPANGSVAPVEIEFKKKSEKGCVFKPHVHETNMIVPSEDVLEGRHYDIITEDDIASCATTPKDAMKAVEWYKNLKGEVKGKMLQLIDVIFFNRKTKEIDYRKEIVAVDVEEAYMLAAQEYGKYNSKVHMRHAHCLFSFVEDNEK